MNQRLHQANDDELLQGMYEVKIQLLHRLQQEHELAYLFISHDLRVVRALSDQIIVMRRGQVVEQGFAATLFSQPAHPYTRALMSAAFDLTVSDETVITQ